MIGQHFRVLEWIFLQIQPKTSVPYSPTGQVMVERSHQVLKEQLVRLKEIKNIDERLSEAVFVLNHLCLTSDREDPPASIHFQTINIEAPNVFPQIRMNYRDPATGTWKGPYGYRNTSNTCGYNDTARQGLGAYGAETRGNNYSIWNNLTAMALPPDVFLICGDRAWQGIPANAIGGPCYLGKLTIFAPSFSQLWEITRHTWALLAPDCNDNVELLGVAARAALAILVPGAAAAATLNNLEKLVYWTEKQAHATTEILEEMLPDQNSLRHALLQDRAAIDFLLLAQGHGCEDFEGMCCMNLSDHNE
nr:uncharacterized protein LOC119714320 [Anas platyrhynchos]